MSSTMQNQGSGPRTARGASSRGRAVLAGFLATASAVSLLLAGPIDEAAPVQADGVAMPGGAAARPATERPVPSLAFPLGSRAGLGLPAAPRDRDLPLHARAAFLAAWSFAPGSLRPIPPAPADDPVVGMMAREARRTSREGRQAAWSRLAVEDSDLEAESAREAERIVTRAVRRTLDRRLEALAEATPGFGAAMEWVQGLGGSRRGARSGRAAADLATGGVAAPGLDASGEPVRGPLTGSLRLRLDAHPKLEMGAEFRSFRARLDVPLLASDPLRLSLDRPLGRRSEASLVGGADADGRSWAFLSFNLRF